MEPKGMIYFAYCGINSTKEKDDQKWQAIRDLYPDAVIINPEKKNGFGYYYRPIKGCDFLIVSEIEGEITADVYNEIAEAFEWKIPVYVIRKTDKDYLFYEVSNLEQLEGKKTSLICAKVVLRNPDDTGLSEIDRNLLSSPSTLFASPN